MNGWLWVACVLLPAGVGPCLWRAGRGRPAQRLAGMALAGVVSTAVFLVAARGLHRSASYTDVALVLAVLAPAGTLVFARCLAGGSGAPGEEPRPAGAEGRG